MPNLTSLNLQSSKYSFGSITIKNKNSSDKDQVSFANTPDSTGGREVV